jgi:hypothetical protein
MAASAGSPLWELYRKALHAYVRAATRLENASVEEFNEAYMAAENARSEFEILRAKLSENSSAQDALPE